MQRQKTSIIGKKIAAARKRRGISQRELADRIGIESSRLCRIEAGFHVPAYSTVEAVAAALKMSVGDLAKSGRAPRSVVANKDQRLRQCEARAKAAAKALAAASKHLAAVTDELAKINLPSKKRSGK